MRLEATRAQGWFWVDWWLHNHCSWRCSYCPEILRTGSIDWPYLKDCLTFLEDLASHCQSQGLRPQIKFTGGEPTEWPGFQELLARAHSLGMSLGLRSNASVDHRLWAELCQYLDRVELNFHPEHTQTSVYLLNLDRAHKQGLEVRCVFNMLPERFSELESTIDYVKKKYPEIYVERRMLFEDPARNTEPMAYTPEQQVKIVRQHGDIRITDGDTVEFWDYPALVSEGRNRFEGAECSAGLEQIIVDAYGRVARGHCRQGGHIGTVGKQIRWPADPVRCHRPDCFNAFDILASKVLG